MAVSQLPQAPYRQDRKIFPTPIIGDVLFSEVRDCTRSEIPEYGTAHPNPKKWPDHKLVFVKPVDIERDGIFEFFYAAERENQDLYNFSSGYRNVVGNAGGREFRVVQRSYVTLRDKFQPMDIEFATPMMNVPEGKFDDVEYVFFDRQQQQIQEQELNALFVAEVHTYIEKAFLDYKISYGAQKADLVPEKFRASIVQTTTEQIVEGLAEPPTLTGSQLSVTEDQINPDIKLVKEVSREKPTGPVVLHGSQAYVGGTVAKVTETYSPEEMVADSGFLIQQSTVSPTGDGAYIKETVSVEEWPTLISADWDNTLNALSIKKQTVERTSTLINGELKIPNTPKSVAYEIVNEDRSVRIEEYAPKEIETYLSSSRTRINLNVPPVLKSIEVLWETGSQVSNYSEVGGDQTLSVEDGTVSTSSSGTSSAQGSARPVFNIQTEQIWANELFATNFFYFVREPDNYLQELKNRIGGDIKEWPIFTTKTYTLTGVGKSVEFSDRETRSESLSKSVDREAKSESKGKGEGSGGSTDFTINKIGPCLCAGISLPPDQSEQIITIVRGRKGWGYYDNIDEQEGTFWKYESRCYVYPASLEATSVPDVPRSGLYVVDSRIEPYKWGYYRVIATVFDASQLA